MFGQSNRMPWEFPYGTPDALSVVPMNPHDVFGPKSTQAPQDPTKRTLNPYVTGSSVIGIRFKDGVMLASDTLASYGSLARYRSVERMKKLTDEIVIGATGDYSDFQEIFKMLNQLIVSDEIKNDGSKLSPNSVHSYLTRVLYARRNKFDPYYGQFIIAGFQNGKQTLGLADLRGTSFQDDTIATGYGAYIARPILRKAFKPDLSQEQAKEILESCMRVLFYRDARTYNRIQLATVTTSGVDITAPYSLSTDWSIGNIVYDKNIKTLEEESMSI